MSEYSTQSNSVARKGAALPALILILIVLLNTAACSDSSTLPPVSKTRPSGDSSILKDKGLMSDGSPVPPHRTTTLSTSMELVSDGLIGGMTIASDGTIYTADLGSHIWKIAPDGTTEMFSTEFEDPSGNLALANGDILQSEWTSNRIYRIRPDGSRTLFSEMNLNGPVAIVQRPQGDFIVANSRGKFLARVPADGGDAEVVLKHKHMTQPNGLTIDPAGNIFIADLDSSVVMKWTPEGDLVGLVELPGRGNAHNVFVNGMLYVNKIWDHVIYRVDPVSGVYGIVSGNGRAGYEDGINGAASIEEPNAIAATADGKTLYFNTHRGAMGRNQNARVIIRKLELDQQ